MIEGGEQLRLALETGEQLTPAAPRVTTIS